MPSFRTQLLSVLRDLLEVPDWVAWRIEARVVWMEDRKLSPPVQDALADLYHA